MRDSAYHPPMFDWFTKRAGEMMQRAVNTARTHQQEEVHVEHLLLSLLEDEHNTAVSVILRMDVDPEELKDAVRPHLDMGTGRMPRGQVRYSATVRQVFKHALDEACDFDHEYIGTEHLLLGILREPTERTRNATSELKLRLSEVREHAADRFEPPPLGPGGRPPLRSLRPLPTEKKFLELELEDLKRALGHLAERVRLVEKEVSTWQDDTPS